MPTVVVNIISVLMCVVVVNVIVSVVRTQG